MSEKAQSTQKAAENNQKRVRKKIIRRKMKVTLLGTIWRDFFPKRREVQEDGIHAKLNYQNIADSQRRSMSILLIVIMLFSTSFILYIYHLTETDVLIEKIDVDNYADYMDVIRTKVLAGESGHLINEEEMLEDNTSLYWDVFFFRFILVRLLIGVTIGIMIAFLIRIYFRIRHDRAVNIHKEEALSTIQYVARGEWRLKYDEKTETYCDVPYIENNKNHVLSTNDFLKTLPIATLFKAPSSEKSRKGGGKGKTDKDLVHTMKQIVSTLSKIEEDLHDMKPR